MKESALQMPHLTQTGKKVSKTDEPSGLVPNGIINSDAAFNANGCSSSG